MTVLCCACTPQDRVLIDAFIKTEEDPDGCCHPDIFLRFALDFTPDGRYGVALRQQLVERYAVERESIESYGVTADWQAPKPDGDDVIALVDACVSYHTHHGLGGRLVLLLDPDRVGDESAWSAWVARFAATAPATLAVVVFDGADRMPLAPLELALPERVMYWRADLDLGGALTDLCTEAGDVHTPGGAFRLASTQTSVALAAGDLPSAEQSAGRAIAVAMEQGWPHLASGIQLLIGTALSADVGRLDEAMLRFEASEVAAIESEATGEQCAPLLRMRARMARGSLLFAQERFEAAAQLYEATAPLAAAVSEHRSVIDCWRLASLAHELDGRPEPAWSCARQGVDAARHLDQQTLESSTFAYLGVAMLRLSESRGDRILAAKLERELTEIAGREDWRPSDVD